MPTRTPLLPLLALAGAVVLSACSTEPVPAAPQAAPSQATVDAADPDAAGQVVDTAVLSVEDQVSKGPTVNVTAALADGGWVVVTADDGRNVLGAGEVPPGTAPQLVQVSLAEVLTEPTELQARLYDDRTADGLYGAGDRPVANAERDDDDDPAFAGETEVFTFTGADVVDAG